MPPRPHLRPLHRAAQRVLAGRAADSRGPGLRRFAASSRSAGAAPPEADPELPPPPPARWHSDLRARLGRCIQFGCSREQAARAAAVLRVLAQEWRGLAAGAEGFLTGDRRGLETQQVVWGEMDSFGHVNNAVYIRYVESARVNWIVRFAAADPAHAGAWRELMTPRGTGLILQSITADYKFPMTYPDTISAYLKLRAPPRSGDTALALDGVVLSHLHRRAAARTAETVVVYDYAAGRKAPLPPFALAVLRAEWRRQLAEARRARARVAALTADVVALERATWDREGAVEDFGPAPANP
ncbi:HotDog domain-containing protein [Durotheca rogersii]|uniref:HotDog domain-containing protein n=1 Tax=Durotheca rogersii TaxID=419775 RepID=UPI00221F69F0|nr:HotDog domain-containing protein [Durotheca rogersii]KAI5865383.1 HotDog domain-containing protein [Durotheca rogersii]